MREFIIGKNHAEPIAIPASKSAVSGTHVKITVSDDRKTWVLEDLNSTNGTYIRDDEGNFRQVYKCYITEKTIIRLGGQGITSFAFMAHRVFVSDPTDYSYEFGVMVQDYMAIKQEITTREQINKNHNSIRIFAPIIGLGLSCCIPSGSQLAMWGIRLSITIPTFLVGWLFRKDADKLKEILNKKAKLFMCPRCGKPLADHFVQQHYCPSCGAGTGK